MMTVDLPGAYMDFFLRLIAAAFLGALIGFERDIHGRAAGLRTHLLVSMGAAAFVILSGLIASAGQPDQRVGAVMPDMIGDFFAEDFEFVEVIQSHVGPSAEGKIADFFGLEAHHGGGSAVGCQPIGAGDGNAVIDGIAGYRTVAFKALESIDDCQVRVQNFCQSEQVVVDAFIIGLYAAMNDCLVILFSVSFAPAKSVVFNCGTDSNVF